eukprot:2021426-Alexandrium_andersonii.AAC.1
MPAPTSSALLCSACPDGLGGHPAGWWAGAVCRRGSKLTASARSCRRVRLVSSLPLRLAYRPLGPL